MKVGSRTLGVMKIRMHRTLEGLLGRLDEAVRAVAEAATGAFLNSDPEPLKLLWSRSDDVTIFGGYGSFERGWEQVGPRLDWAAKRFRGGRAEYEPIATGVSGDLAYAIGIERGLAHVVDRDEPGAHVLRVTHLFRREDGEWKLIHRHADALIGITTAGESRRPP